MSNLELEGSDLIITSLEAVEEGISGDRGPEIEDCEAVEVDNGDEEVP